MTSIKRDAQAAALHTLKKLRAHGHAALFAGGCVRDMLLSVSPKDYDVCTDARPERVLEIFPRARKVGVKFGVVLVHRFGHDIEVATFRSDGSYSDGRHPDSVTFGSEVEDAARRDFTINGLFHDPITDTVIDHVEGRKDLEAGIIRTIGDPRRRFGEDHLRMLRAVRFGARFGFTVEPATLHAIVELADRLALISPERIWLELDAILTARTRARGWELLTKTGLYRFVAKGCWDSAMDLERIGRRLAALPDARADSQLAFAASLVPRSGLQARSVCRALRLSGRDCDSVRWLLESLPIVRDPQLLDLADLKTLMANRDWSILLCLLRADLLSERQASSSYDDLCARAAKIPDHAVAPPPLLSGDDLVALGVPAGPRFGDILRRVYRAQLNEELNCATDAESLARKLIESTPKEG